MRLHVGQAFRAEPVRKWGHTRLLFRPSILRDVRRAVSVRKQTLEGSAAAPMCPYCGETRDIEIVYTGPFREWFCRVCGKAWVQGAVTRTMLA